MAKLKRTSYDDTLVREFIIKFCDEKWSMKLKSNDELYKIDLVGVDDLLLGVEVEHGKWEGNFWENDNYSLISEQKFRTINIPGRKEKYFLPENTVRSKVTDNLSYQKNIFMRTNKDFTQVIVIRSNTVRDKNKMVRTRFQPKNSNEVENWLSFRREDVETYTLINGTFVLEQVEKTNILKKLCRRLTHLLK